MKMRNKIDGMLHKIETVCCGFWGTAIKIWISLIAVFGNVLTVLEWGYEVEIPIIKYIFPIFQNLNRGGMLPVLMSVALGVVYYNVRNKQKNVLISAVSGFIAVLTVFGKSYEELGNWDYIFHGRLQFGLAVFVMVGYYFLYKNILIYAIEFVNGKKEIFIRCSAHGKVEEWIFVKHPFAAPLLIAFVFMIPYYICFLPGTLQWDAHAQIWQSMGIGEMTANHPVLVTKLMGKCVALGRMFFGSDSMGLFLYAVPQSVVQCFIFAYVMLVLTRIKSPMWIRWLSIVLYFVIPVFPIWGLTVVKDSGYYLCTVLLVTVLADILYCTEQEKWYHYVLMIVSTVGLAAFRNNGRYVIYLVTVWGIIWLRKYWKIYLTSFFVCFFVVFALENVYIPTHEIKGGTIGEVLSIPLQQTARYVKEHYNEVTPEEKETLEMMFGVELQQLAELYQAEISDPVKATFMAYPHKEELKQYFTVWTQQFRKHPDTYIQAVLNHMYGYLYPDRESFWGNEVITYIGNQDHWQDDYLDMQFMLENGEGRKLFRAFVNLLSETPVLGMFFSCGLHGYILLGCIIWVIRKKHKRGLLILFPAFVVWAGCLGSPVNVFFRYMLPVIVTLPFHLSVCFEQSTKQEKLRYEDKGI